MERQVVRADYTLTSTFVVPEGIDLDNTEQVEEWWIKWDTLHIWLQDGRKFVVKPYYSATTSASDCYDDFKHPDNTDITKEDVDSDYDDAKYVSTHK